MNMKIEMKPILNGETNSIVIDYEFELSREYVPDDITMDKPVKVDGAVTARAGFTELILQVKVDYTIGCARCLEPISDTLVIDIVKTVAAKGTLENEDNEDYIIIEEGVIEIEDIIIEEITVELPARQVCSEDCKGLCPKCGKNLNETNCGCVTKEIDPRLAILQQYLDKDKD